MSSDELNKHLIDFKWTSIGLIELEQAEMTINGVKALK